MRIIALPLYGIGDVLMCTPALRNIKECLPDSHITFLHMFETTRDILLGNSNVDENRYFPFLQPGMKGRGFKFLLDFRGKYDISINFYPSNRRDYNLAALLVGCKERIGHRYRLLDFMQLNFLKNRTVLEDDLLHNVEENLRLLAFIGIKEPRRYPLELHLLAEEEHGALEWLTARKLRDRVIVGFHPGSSVFKEHAQKRWPLEKFAALIDGFVENRPESFVILFGGPEEDPLKDSLRAMCRQREHVFYPVGFRGIRETAALVKRCSVFVANDSGLMHLSAALQVPTVAIFGPTNPRWLAPWKCPAKVIRLATDCGPCFRYSPIPQRCIRESEFSCVREIDVKEVLEAVLSFL